jgi:hypothetical protein
MTGSYDLSPQRVVKMLVPVMLVSGAAVLILVVLMKGSASPNEVFCVAEALIDARSGRL